MENNVKYFAMIEGEQRGPFTLEQLPEAHVLPDTFVWCKGMEKWEPARTRADICRFYRQHIADIQHPVPSLPEVVQPTDEEAPEGEQLPVTRFDRWIDETEEGLPTPEEINSRYSDTVPPSTWLGVAIIVTLLCCPLTGVVAIYNAVQSRKAWRAGQHKEAYDYARGAKMWTGISVCISLIFYAVLLRNLM